MGIKKCIDLTQAKRHKWTHHKFKKGGEYYTSHSTCDNCNIKRKLNRYKPNEYQYPDGTIVTGKAPKCEIIFYKIVDKNGFELPDKHPDQQRTYDEAKRIVDRLNENGEHKPYKMIKTD